MRPLALAVFAALIPITAAAQQPTTPPPAPLPAPVVTPPTTTPAPVTDSATPAPAPVVAPVPVAAPVPTPATAAPAADGATISPGMSRAEVEAAWGKAGNSRTEGGWTYLFYKNDCGRRCGTFDVVFLHNDKVTDAIVRASYRHYAGTSTSPADRAPAFTPPAG